MKKTLLLIPVVAMLAACGTSDPYAKRAEQERERQERYVERAIDKAPKWFRAPPLSSSAVYEVGTARGSDWMETDNRAKQFAYAKLCMTAGGTVSQRSKMYLTSTETGGSELSETAIRSSCKEVDLTGVEVKEVKHISEGPHFRTYVLVALPTGDANILRKAKEAARQRELAAARAPQAFKELD